MKLKHAIRLSGALGTAVHIALLVNSQATITVDGSRDLDETEYSEKAVQATTSNWGAGNVLANLHAGQDGSKLGVFLAGKPAGNAFILFIDSKAGGTNFIPNNLISSGGEEYTINNLGTSASAGMTFEAGFSPDYAVRIYSSGDASQAHVNRYDLQAGSRAYVGQSQANWVPPSGFISEIATIWQDVTGAYSAATMGVEMKLNLAALGVPSGSGQTVKLMAVLVNDNSTYGSNQVLGSRTSSPDDIGGGINAINFETEAGTQTMSVVVDNLDTDGDGDPDISDPDDDNDGLPDTVETNTGTYVSTDDTGTNPLIEDTDGDTFLDGQEVDESALGYLSDPNKDNYTVMAVAGSFTTPAWQPDGSAGNSMTQAGTSLTGQYQWSLNYRFTTLGAIEYKYAAGSWTTNWGNGGNNFTAQISGTGFHTFSFNNSTLTQSLTRTVFPSVSAFLTAYGVSSGTDTDGDGVNNEAEFTANTDPTEDDTDGDGALDGADSNPLLATRDVAFTVNMTVQEANGNFNPATGSVVVKFFTGLLAGTSDLALTEVGDTGIYTGTLANVAGAPGANSGDYKFFNSTPGAPNGGYETSDNRSFVLGPVNATQTLDTVFFSNDSNLPGGYGSWAADNAGGQPADQDFDLDGVSNGVEYFMGETGSTFTNQPGVTRTGGLLSVTWTKGASYSGVYGVNFVVETSASLIGGSWTDAPSSATPDVPGTVHISGNSVTYTFPAGTALFARLKVNTP